MNVYTNARFLIGNEFRPDVHLVEKNGKIADIISNTELPGDTNVVDLGGHYAAPSLIDLQIYGGNGKMFSSELSIETLKATVAYSRAGGAAHIMITLATNSMDVFHKGIDVVRDYWSQGKKGILGLHLEGPYLNPSKKGAHIERYIRKPQLQEVRELLERGKDIVKMITIAPEQFDEATLRLLLESGILVSAGHSNATYEQATSGFKSGIATCTHLFNAMSGLQHRAPGLVGAIYDHPRVHSSIVADGIHVDFPAVRISQKVMGDRLFYITDAVAAVATGDYPHVFKGDRYTMPDGTLSGSALTMMQCVRNGVQHCGFPLVDSLRKASAIPASLIGEKNSLGQLSPGFDCSMVVFNEALEVLQLIG